MCKINDKLARYKQMRDEFPAEELLKVCIARYEINMIQYEITNDPARLAVINALGKLMDKFYEVEYNKHIAARMDINILK
jgi:hypothetical protein